MKLFASGQAFNRRDLFPRNRSDLGDARSLRLSVNQDGASAALPLSAAVFAPGQIKLLAQNTEQAGLRFCINCVRSSVYGETNAGHPLCSRSRSGVLSGTSFDNDTAKK